MKYITGYKSLNLPCSLETTGDWHQSTMDWENIQYSESDNSVFGNFGIELCTVVPNHLGEEIPIANTLRAILDIMQTSQLRTLKGFRDDYLSTDKYDEIFFEKVLMLKNTPNWEQIDAMMIREFNRLWKNYKQKFDK